MNKSYRFLVFAIFLAFSFTATAQKKAPSKLYILYIDNSLPQGDGLTGAMLSDIVAFMDTVKDKKFLLFLSNGKRFQMTDNPRTADEIINGLTTTKYSNTTFPDQNEDALTLRRKLVPVIKDFTGEINFVLYTTNKFASELQYRYSPLAALFPKEIANLYSAGIKKVTVLINYPQIGGSRVNEEEITGILNFTGTSRKEDKVVYLLNTTF